VNFNDTGCQVTFGANIIDFPILGCGFVQPPTNMCLFGQVYCDADSSGTFTPGDFPMDSVPLILNSSQGQLNALSTLSGNYNFAYPGTSGQASTVAIDPAWLVSNGFSTISNPVSFIDTACQVTFGANIIDFPILGCGFVQPPANMCVSGQVYCDIDSSGTFTLGDIPLDSVPVFITTPQGQITAYTNMMGNYSLTYTGIAGAPTVVMIDPAWLAQNGIIGFTPFTVQNTICGQVGAIADFPLQGCGITPPPLSMCLSGLIYCDMDTNGQFGLGDIALDSVPITIITSTALMLNTFTNANGMYSFTYQSTAGMPTIISIDPVWLALNGITGNAVSNTLDTPCLVGGAVVNFPLTGCNQGQNNMCLSGQVYCDMDSNNIFSSGDIPFANVPITAMSTNNVNVTVMTDSNGFYNIIYQTTNGDPVVVTIDNMWLLSNGYNTSSSVVTTQSTPCSSTGNGAVVNFPIYGCSGGSPFSSMCLSGLVFCDMDSNGVYNMGDVVLDSVPIIINLGFGGIINTITDSSGMYSANYQGMPQDPTMVSIDNAWLIANGYTTLGFNPAIVFNVPCNSSSGGATANFPINCNSILPNPNDMCISGYVFCDIDSNGMFTPWDTPIAQAPVILHQAANPAMVVYTDNSGFYNVVYQGNVVSVELDTIWLINNGYTTPNNPVSINNTPCITAGTITNFPVNGCTTNILDDNTASNINIYPNPFNDVITISSPLTILQLQIVDITGRIIMNLKEINGVNKIDLSNLDQGNYLMIIETSKGFSTKKIQKN